MQFSTLNQRDGPGDPKVIGGVCTARTMTVMDARLV